jgi:hypothetical protein
VYSLACLTLDQRNVTPSPKAGGHQRFKVVALVDEILNSGPLTLFDKSALQSFSLDEAVWFDNFYATIISPLFFVETLADLSKEVEQGRTPEQVVGTIAAKTPETGSIVNAPRPPLDGDYLTTKLWDRFLLPIWRDPVPPASEMTSAKRQALVKAISDSGSLEKKLGRPVSSMPGKLEDLDHVVLSRRVHGRKGKWQILPPEVLENQSQ